jgi:hypothetical protein
MRYNKKNVPLLLVPLLIIIFFSGNASADTYSFSVSSTSGDRNIFYFTVNSCITINGEATWTGSAANLALILNGPGQEGYYVREDGLSPLSLSYTVTTADLSKGTDWRLSIVNFGGGDATGTVTIVYPTDSLFDRMVTSHQAMSHQAMSDRSSTVKYGADLKSILLEEEIDAIGPFFYIDIASSPQGAQIWIDGEYCGVTPFRGYFDRHGDHTFKLCLNEYKPYQESFFISESRSLDVVLEPLPEETPIPPGVGEPFIYIDIDSSPQGAQIWIDGEYCGVTPLREYFDRTGDHTFKLSKHGYKPYQESFFISESRTLDLVLEPFIYIDIDSSPQGAQIWIDGEYSGVTPLREYFDRPGNHTFKLSLHGYKPYQESFFVSESGILDVILEPLPEETPTPVAEPFIYIDIDSSPQGAQIWIDGEYSGVTPFREYFDRPGDHTFKLSLQGYKPYQESFFISESRTLDVVLEPLAAEVAGPFIYIDIDSSPQGAQIWIDDEYSGVTPFREYFDRPGDHTFKLSLHGYQHYQESFFISESRTLDLILEPLDGETSGSPARKPVPSHPSPTPPGFLALSLLIAIFFVYFFKFKNKRWRKSKN